MDREIAIAICAAVVGLSIVGNMMLGPRASEPVEQQHAYAPEDIRYKFQQSESKKKHKPRTQAAAPKKLAPEGTTSSSSSGGGDSDPSNEVQEEPSLSDEGDAEEPSLD